MMTGRLPSDIGVFDNGAEFLPSEPTYAHYLRTLGYKTTLSARCTLSDRTSCTGSRNA